MLHSVDENGKIIGSVYKIGNSIGIWGGKVYSDNEEGTLGQYIDSDWARKAVENYWDVMSRTLLENRSYVNE